MLKPILIFVFILSCCSCSDPSGNSKAAGAVPCIDNLKGHTFELYRIDTQSFKISDNTAVGLSGSFSIDSNSTSYKQYRYSLSGDSVTIITKNHSTTQTFRIINDTAYWGSDPLPVQACSSEGVVFIELDGSSNPDWYLKAAGYTRRIQ